MDGEEIQDQNKSLLDMFLAQNESTTANISLKPEYTKNQELNSIYGIETVLTNEQTL